MFPISEYKGHNPERIEQLIENELEHQSFLNCHPPDLFVVAYRKAKWKDLKNIPFVRRIWLATPKWLIALVAIVLTFIASNWKDILEVAGLLPQPLPKKQ